MRSFGFGIPPALLWSFVLFLLSVARLASCAPIAVAGGIDVVGFKDANQGHPPVLSDNAPNTPLLVPISTQITPPPASAPATSSKRHPSAPLPTTDIIDIDTSGPTRPFPFKFLEYLTKSTHTHQDSNAHSANIFFSTFFGNDDPDHRASVLRGRFPFNYLSRVPSRGSASIMVLSSASTGSTSSTPTLNVITMPATEGRPAVEQEPSESSQFPLGIWQTNVDSDALADSPPEAPPIAEVFSVKAAINFVSTIIGMMNPTRLKSEYLVSEKTVDADESEFLAQLIDDIIWST